MHNHQTSARAGDFSPITSLFNPDGDTVLIFLSANGIQFFDATSDPWYRATIPGDKVYSQALSDGVKVYMPEEAASPMGCISQYQFCNPSLSSNNCGPLASWYDAAVEAWPLFGMTLEDGESGTIPTANNTMGSRYLWLLEVFASGQTSINNIVMGLGPDALTTVKYLHSGIVAALPINQWQFDVRYWWATYLASLQAAVVNAAHGPGDPALEPYEELPFNSHARDICNNQVRYIAIHVRDLKLTWSARILTENPQYQACLVQPLRALLHLGHRRPGHHHLLRSGAHF